ncbi:aminodeoxychorismate synthase component I [Leptospira sp. 201903070]|uniref:Aminodeoxychorismate synthase component I n=1 Tax=Leptospira ainlahdjerensis TaxID=2810033 RepID=A0ABS2UFF1_9LEPT|nr:aminodeoxychorismate synthase component I [Leptospira ainlahdjerensis]MBM9579106.1 aminodeoxychorismate synthase component I [Leptospira ainlahdjerensis]
MRIEELLFSDQPFMIFDEGFHPSGKILFRNPITTIKAFTSKEIESSLREIQLYIQKGFYVAGFISYESGEILSGMNQKDFETDFPFLYFGVFHEPEILPKMEEAVSKSFGFHISSLPNRKKYFENLKFIREKLFQGEIYQINYTDRILFDFEGDILSFYNAIFNRQPVPYGSWIRIPDWDLLSFSPELFFEKQGRSMITKPMKGTSPRGKTESEDDKNVEFLKNSEKEIAENLMITDLMRNDLGKISRQGSVHVQELFSVEKYKTILQMTSTIRSELSFGVETPDIFRELFPGGSITGAPKLRAMELIRELEKPRGIYTGAIGIFRPNSDAVFSIAIRTLEISHGKGKLGIGSGITWDADPEKEWLEILEKAKFFSEAPKNFFLFETILYKNGIFYFQKEHRMRMKTSAETLDFPFSEDEWDSCLQKVRSVCKRTNSYRIKICLNTTGNFYFEHSILSNFPKKGNLQISLIEMDSSSEFRKHKTNLRDTYDREGTRSRNSSYLDVLFLNEKREITEGSITNVFLKIGDSYFTPLGSSGILPGIYRNRLLKRKGFYERSLSLEDLKSAESVFLCNSLRGILRVHKIESSSKNPHSESSCENPRKF